ncbi:MAG: flagellar export protein FliJ [Clostridia bacterium]|nr:flagellar export protein FliJ [Clostridia bacterium]MDD4146473.1 flagellar export protein FliJ [Clostridia bacterium]
MFKFRLEKILRLREYKEKFCLEEVGKCVSQLQDALEKKEELEERKTKLENEFMAILKGVISAEKVSLYKNYLLYQDELLKIQEQVIEVKKNNLEEARQKLVQAMKERKILEKLREKQDYRYQQEQEKNEQIFQDELAVTSKRR